MNFLPEEIEKYSEVHTSAESEWLCNLNRETHQKILKPRMLSGHMQGRILSMFSQMIKPERILEIGTYTGYSALCLAEGLAENGKLITIDINEELQEFVQKHIDASPYKNKIEQRIGNALEVIPTLNEQFDIVFIDADKQNYIEYYEMVLPLVKSGGYIILDNVLWSGKVADLEKNDKDTVLLRKLNDIIHEDICVEEVLLPIRDGLMVARKK